MGIFRRAKDSVRAKANSAIDRASSPEKELARVIAELQRQRKVALDELLSYKTTAKQMEQDIARLREKVSTWEKRAMVAIKRGEDDAARQCLREKRLAGEELARIERDQREAAGYAAELNRSRKQVETRLRMLEMKKGTMANQIAAARAGGNAFGQSDALFDKLAQAEGRIDDEALLAEALSEGALGDDAPAAALSAEPAAPGDDALAALKQKMRAALPEGGKE